jgi:hypothetical protein
LESMRVSASTQEERRANYERGKAFGEQPSNGMVTVPTSPGGENSEGSCACGDCRAAAETSFLGTKPSEPHSR